MPGWWIGDLPQLSKADWIKAKRHQLRTAVSWGLQTLPLAQALAGDTAENVINE